MIETLFAQSLELSHWLQSLASWLDPVMEFFIILGEERFYLLVMPVVLWLVDYQLGFRVGVMLLLTSGINQLLKISFKMPRPFMLDPDVARAPSLPGGFGLPSGHSQTPLSVFGLLAVTIKRGWVTAVFLFVIFMTGISRIYLGVHFYLDVLSGWLIGGLVLWAFLKLEGKVQKWLSGESFFFKSGVVFAYSLVMILVASQIIAAAGNYTIPHEWQVNAHIAYPEEQLELLGLNATITSAAAMFGLAVGYFWVNEAGGYLASSGKGWQKLVRFLIGLAGVLVLYMGLGAIFPDHHDLVSYLLRYLRYTLIGFWISGIGPRLFIRTGLAADNPG